MIDPKFNDIAVEEDLLTDEQREAHLKATPIRGLSINDTIAHDANLSVGARGVDTSGVRSGAGAGAGSSYLTPDPDDSAAPEIEPGVRGTGMSPLADAPDGETSTERTSFDK